MAPKPPIAPGETLITPAGLPSHALLPYGREPTSIAFFSTPGTERLYSGVTNSTASAPAIFSLNATDAGGGFGVVVLVVERQLADLDDLERERRRRHGGERFGHLAVERVLAQAADDDGDAAGGGHIGIPSEKGHEGDGRIIVHPGVVCTATS